MKLNTKWVTFGFKSLNHFSSFSVPKQYLFVVACAQKATTIVCEANISNCLRVSPIRPNALSVRHDVPYFARTIMARTQQKMTKFGEEFYSLNSLVVAAPSVHPLFRNETLVTLHSQIAWRLNKTLSKLICRRCFSWNASSMTVINWLWFKLNTLLAAVSFWCLLQTLFPFFLKFFHQSCLMFIKSSPVSLFVFAFFISFKRCPRSSKFGLASISASLSLFLHFSSSRFFWQNFLPLLTFSTLFNGICGCCLLELGSRPLIAHIDWGCDSGTVCRIECLPSVIKEYPLFVKAGNVKLSVLQETRQMILIRFYICLGCKFVHFRDIFG